MKALITILLCQFFVFNTGSGQDIERSLNLVIVIDQNVVIGELSKIQLRFGDIILPASYEPGNLSFLHTNEVAPDVSLSPVILSFYYNTYNSRGLIQSYYYEIPLERVWLERSFMVLRVYNTNRKPYKKIYTPLKGLNYTFELDLPTGSINRVRKRL